MNFKTASEKLWLVCEKHERIRAYYNMLNQIDDKPSVEEFWETFWSIWTGSENLHADMSIVDHLVVYGQKLGSSILGLDEDEQEFVSKLPEVVTIFRGCSEQNKQGWSWSIFREKALWFAERSVGSDKRYLLKAKVKREDILGYLSGRNEGEIVVRPESLMQVKQIMAIKSALKGHAQLIYAIHSGSGILDSPEMDKARATMMVESAHDIAGTLTYVEQHIEDMKFFSVNSKMNYMLELKTALMVKMESEKCVIIGNIGLECIW